MTVAGSREAGPAVMFLREITGAGRIAAEHVAIVVAHPDDETVAAGALLARLSGVIVVHVTDGAPHNLADARAQGFATAEGYAAARRRELEVAVAFAGIPTEALLGLGMPDQEAAWHLPDLSRRLAAILSERSIGVVLTHAYEGGHPDHDATAFAVHASAALLAREGRELAVVEMPFYRAGPAGWVVQHFDSDDPPVLALGLGDEERVRKQRMLDAHATQREVLKLFRPECERFRPAPAYDFTALPNGGHLLYERYDWGMTGARWRDLVREARAALGLVDPA